METEKPELMSLFHDETGSFSSGRVLLWIMIIFSIVFLSALFATDALDTIPVDVLTVVLAYLQTIIMAIIGWVGGARLAQYVFPAIGPAAGALFGRLKSVLPSPTTSTTAPTESTADTDMGSVASTDVSELSNKG